MKRITFLAAIPLTALSLAACAADAPPKDDGWIPLPAAAWRLYKRPAAEGLSKRWNEEPDGTLHSAPGDDAEHQTDLVTHDGTFRDFELELEWKVARRANSGVLYRFAETGRYPWQTGFEYQVLDDANYKIGPPHQTGALYAIAVPDDRKVLKATGEWNTTRIVAQGDHLEHWLNGKCIVKVDLSSKEFKDAFAKSEWRGNPAKGAAPNGFIGLQDHGCEAWYRRIRIRKLAAPAAK